MMIASAPVTPRVTVTHTRSRRAARPAGEWVILQPMTAEEYAALPDCVRSFMPFDEAAHAEFYLRPVDREIDELDGEQLARYFERLP